LFGFIAGWIIDRYGPRRMMMAGALMAGIALIGLSFTKSLWMFYFFYIFSALGYVFGGPLPVQVLITRWFDKNRGKAMGIAYLGIGMGGAIVHLISAGFEKNLGWNHALAFLGLLIIIIAFPLPLFIKDSPGKFFKSDISVTNLPFRDILLKRNFFLVAVGSMCSIGAVGGVIQHLKLYLIDLSFTQAGAAQVMSLVLLFSLVGRVLMGMLADLTSCKYVMLLIYSIIALSIPLLLMPDFTGRIYLFAILFGISLGGAYMIIPLVAGDLFGVRVLGRIMGIVIVADGVAESSVPMVIGFLFDEATNSYANGFILLTGLAIAGVIITSLLTKNR
jgi:sugar phosphate permease